MTPENGFTAGATYDGSQLVEGGQAGILPVQRSTITA